MKKKEIKKILRENIVELDEANSNTKIKSTKKIVQDKDSDESEDQRKGDTVSNLLKNNDIINHAAVVRRMTGQEWVDNSEATNRSKFRKKLNRMTNDEGGAYSFDEDEISEIEKVLMSLSSTISTTIGKQGR